MTPTEYFTTHALDPDFLKKSFGVTYNDTTITIPVYGQDKKLLYTKTRHLEHDTNKEIPKFTYQPAGGHAALFAAYKIKEEKAVILCEGEPDCMKLWQEGFPAVTSTSGVQAFNQALAAPLKGKKVYICLDTDKAGRDSVEKYFTVLLEAQAIPAIIELPTEFKDVCEYFAAGMDKEDFRVAIQTAITLEDWQEANEPETYKAMSGKELLALPIPEEEWYIDRVLPTEGFVFIVGAEATGKSFYTLALAHSLTTGSAWLDNFTTCKQTKVLFIDKENTKRRTQKRLKNLKIDGEGMFWLRYPEYFDLNDEKAEDGFSPFAHAVARLVKKEKIGVIFIDSFADIMVGNENIAGDVQMFFDGFRQLFPGKTIVVLHHEAKPQQGMMRTSSQKVRGSSNITAQMVVGFRVSPIPKMINEFIIEQIKAGDAEKLPNFKVSLVSSPDPADSLKTVVSKIEYGGEVVDAEQKVTEAVEKIKELFETEDNLPKMRIIDHCTSLGIGRRTVERAIKEMEDGGILDSFLDEKDKRKKVFFLAKEIEEEDEDRA